MASPNPAFVEAAVMTLGASSTDIADNVSRTNALIDAMNKAGNVKKNGFGPYLAADIEFAIRQLVEVADRALSPGTNDPYTAISVLDRLGASLCDVAGRGLPTGVTLRDGRPVL